MDNQISHTLHLEMQFIVNGPNIWVHNFFLGILPPLEAHTVLKPPI